MHTFEDAYARIEDLSKQVEALTNEKYQLMVERDEAREMRDRASVNLASMYADLLKAEQAIDGTFTNSFAVRVVRRLLWKAIHWIRDTWTLGRYQELKRSFEQLVINAKQSSDREQHWQSLYYSGQRILISKEVDQLRAQLDRMEDAFTRICELLTPEQLRVSLEAEGVDVDAFEARIRAVISRPPASDPDEVPLCTICGKTVGPLFYSVNGGLVCIDCGTTRKNENRE